MSLSLLVAASAVASAHVPVAAETLVDDFARYCLADQPIVEMAQSLAENGWSEQGATDQHDLPRLFDNTSRGFRTLFLVPSPAGSQHFKTCQIYDLSVDSDDLVTTASELLGAHSSDGKKIRWQNYGAFEVYAFPIRVTTLDGDRTVVVLAASRAAVTALKESPE